MNRRPWWTRFAAQPMNDEARLLADPAQEMTAERMALDSAFRTLSVEQRAACVLHLHMGYAVAETAELMGAPVETTPSRPPILTTAFPTSWPTRAAGRPWLRLPSRRPSDGSLHGSRHGPNRCHDG